MATGIEIVPMADILSLSVGSGLLSVTNPSSDEGGAGGSWVFFFFFLLSPFFGVLRCLSEFGTIVERIVQNTIEIQNTDQILNMLPKQLPKGEWWQWVKIVEALS